MITIHKSIVYKANKQGAGFIRLPQDSFGRHHIGKQLYIILYFGKEKLQFAAKIRFYVKIGFFVPIKYCNKYNLLTRIVKYTFKKIEGFITRIGSDGRIYLPTKEAQRLKIKQNEIIYINGCIGNKQFDEFSQVKTRVKGNTSEFMCMFNSNLSGKEGIFRLNSIASRNSIPIQQNINKIINEFNYAPIKDNNIILFLGNRIPVIINSQFSISEFAHYLGCYFADGTKKGNSWGICASTFQQANYFLEKHRSLICDPNLRMELTYTDPFNEQPETLKKRLQQIWLQKTKINIPKERIWIYKTQSKDSQNRNLYGALSIREHKQIVLIYYNSLLKYLINKIIKTKNQIMALNFICGILEGDGSPSAKSRGHISIATNKKEVNTIIQVFSVLDFKHEGYEEDKNKFSIRIGSLELMKNIIILKEKLFKYYPKRRKRFIQRFLQTGAVKFVMGKQSSTSGWIKKYLFDDRIVNRNYHLTKKGKKIQSALLELEKEVTES